MSTTEDDSYGLHLLADVASMVAINEHLLDYPLGFQYPPIPADLGVPEKNRSLNKPKKRRNFSLIESDKEGEGVVWKNTQRRRRGDEQVPKQQSKKREISPETVREVFKREAFKKLTEMMERSDFDYKPASSCAATWCIQATSGLRLRFFKVPLDDR